MLGSNVIRMGCCTHAKGVVSSVGCPSDSRQFHRSEQALTGSQPSLRSISRPSIALVSEEEARSQSAHNIFRVDIDIIPDTTALDTFQEAFGFRPPAEPLLAPVFSDGEGEALDDYVTWTAPKAALIAPAASLAAMKIRAFPERDKSHKRLKDLADLHALLWYVEEYGEMRSTVRDRVQNDDVETFRAVISDGLYQQTASLIGVDIDIVQQSIEQRVM